MYLLLSLIKHTGDQLLTLFCTFSQSFNVSYELLVLKVLPNLNNTQGIGSSATAMKPRRLVAQSIPSLWYICRVNNGNTPPRTYLTRPFAAMAEAAFVALYASIR